MPEDFDPTSPDTKWGARGTWILAQQYMPPKKGLIHVPTTSPLQHNTGTVLSVGPDVKSCKAGDTVVWQVFKAQAVGHFDRERWWIKDEDVCGVAERP